MMFLSTGVPVVVTLTTFAAYIFGMKQPLTASTAFTSMALFGLLREAVISSTYLLSSFMRARVSLGRITRFIADTEELDSAPRTFEGDRIEIKEGKFRFSRFGSKGFTLDIDELKVPVGKTTIIAGDVGSGKSALLSALLGEMHKRSGEVKYPARVSTSFAAQSPWLQGEFISFSVEPSYLESDLLTAVTALADDTVKANVLFGEKYDEERYHKTLHACALESDLDGFPDGDQTRVGEKGLSMSGFVCRLVSLPRPLTFSSSIGDRSSVSPSLAPSTLTATSSCSTTFSAPSTATRRRISSSIVSATCSRIAPSSSSPTLSRCALGASKPASSSFGLRTARSRSRDRPRLISRQTAAGCFGLPQVTHRS